jgi:putative flippase GtrA
MKKIYDQFYLNCTTPKNLRLFRFVVAGGLSALLEMFLLIILVEKAHLNYLIANCISFILTNIFNYLLSRHWVFGKSDKVIKVEASLFLFVASFGLALNQIIMWCLTDLLNYNYKIAKLVAILAVVIWNFYGKKILVFSSSTKKEHA